MSASPTTDSAQLARLSRIEGQLRGVRKMIVQGRHCLEIAGQIEAVIGALHGVQGELMNAAVRAAAIEARRLGEPAPLQLCVGAFLHATADDRPAGRASTHSRKAGNRSHVCCSVEASQPRR